jgi:hypothetical protein
VHILDKKGADIIAELKKILKKKQAQLKRYCRIDGKLRHVALIMLSTRGLFSPLNKALKSKPATIGLGRDSKVRAALLHMAHMVAQLSTRPTHIKELVPDDDHFAGYCDLDLVEWQVAFPPKISSKVVSNSNPTGTLTNLDLEMAAALLQYVVLQQITKMKHKDAGTFSDNMPTISWATRMADRSKSPTARRLLRSLTAIQQETQAGPYTVASVAGKKYQMAYVSSCSFHIVDDDCFLTHFELSFPLPHNSRDFVWKSNCGP